MNISHFLRSAALMAIPAAALSMSASPVAAGPALDLQFPGCGTTLQACIDNAASGATITVGQDVVNESITIRSSLTLQGAPGFRPDIESLKIETVSASTLNVSVLSFEVETGIEVPLDKGSGHSITLQGLKVDGLPTAIAGIDLDTTVPATLDVERSLIHIAGDAGRNISVQSDLASGSTSVRLVGNRLEQRGNATGGAGIGMTARGAGSFRADVMNNVVWDVGRCFCGSENGVTAALAGSVQADVNMVGNTIVALRSGDVYLNNMLTAGGHVALDVFNNILGRSRGGGIGLESTNPSTVTYRAGENDNYQNSEPDFLQGNNPGAGNMHVNPHFLNSATGKFTLQATSPVIDRGIVCSPGGVADPDAAGNHRLFGASVDLGAYERGARAPNGVVISDGSVGELVAGTSGDDILCGNGGADILVGGLGNDYLDGGSGGDRLLAGDGNDRLFGGSGNDQLCANDGVKGNDILDGGAGSDEYRADARDKLRSVEVKNACAS